MPGSFTESDAMIDRESLHVNLKRRLVTGELTAIKFTDKDTKQRIAYIPSLDISGYGENDAKANEMLWFSVQEFFSFYFDKNIKELNKQLNLLGWKKGMFNKDFSRSYVDINGQLKNLNAENDKVERVTLTAV